MSMRKVIYGGWLLVVVGLAMVASGLAAAGGGGSAATGLLIGLGGGGLVCLVGGSFMVWLCRGWDLPLGSAAEMHEYGRPANAEVLSVETAQLDAAGARTAKLSVHVRPINENAFETTRTVELPGGQMPAVGETVTIKFDPNSHRDFVLLEQSFEVQDPVSRTADVYFGGLQR